MNKIYINVDYNDKDAARAAGARWDKDAKRWYALDAETAEKAQAAADEHRAEREAAERADAEEERVRREARRIAEIEARKERAIADIKLVRSIEVFPGAQAALARAKELYALRSRKSFLHADEERELRRIYSEHCELFDAFELPGGTRNRTECRLLKSATANVARAQQALVLSAKYDAMQAAKRAEAA